MADLPIVPSDLSTLDRGLLEALVIAQQKQMLAKDEAIAAHHEKLISRDNEIEHLKIVIAKLRRMIFGTKSEKVTREIEQLELKLEELETGKAERVSATTRRTHLHGTSRRGAHCLRIYPVKCIPICPLKRHAPTVAANCASWAKMSPRFWNAFLPAIR